MSPIFRCLSKVRQTRLLSQAVCNVGFRGVATCDKLVDVQFNKDTEVSTVVLQRKPVNGLNLELLEELNATLECLEKDKSAGMILTSAMPTIFCAGLDIMEMYQPKPERVKKFWTTLQDVWLKLYGASYPTVAAITGHSPAGGCLLALSCEYRIMVGPKYTIGLNETKLGIVAPFWFIDSMTNVIGQRQTELALTTGRMFSTAEAIHAGLVDEEAKDAGDAIERAEKFICSMSEIPPQARSLTKSAVRSETIAKLIKNKEKDLDMFLKFVNMPDVQQGLEMYLQMLKMKKK